MRMGGMTMSEYSLWLWEEWAYNDNEVGLFLRLTPNPDPLPRWELKID